MVVQNILYEGSFDFKNKLYNEELTMCVEKLDKVTEACNRLKEAIFYKDELYNAEILEDENFADWLYCAVDTGEDADIKQSLREILDKRCTYDTIKPDLTNVMNLCLYKIDDSSEKFIQGLSEWIMARRRILAGIYGKQDFQSELPVCFPNIHFSDEIHTGLNSLKQFSDWVPEIVAHLSVLNDNGLLFFNKHGEVEAMKYIAALLPSGAKCTGENGKGRDKLKFKFSVANGKTLLVDCFPHTKMENAYSDGRIYFRFKYDEIDNGERLVVGWIGGHRD